MGYLFPSINEQFYQLRSKKIFSVIDLNSGYYQIKIKDKHITITSFVLQFGQYGFFRMFFGLTGAPKTFTLAINKLFSEIENVNLFWTLQ